MTSQEAAERQAAHECLQQELVEALQWAASALQVIANGVMPAHELDLIHRADQSASKSVGQILDAADEALAKARNQ
ncbi:hypothetical protein CNECB9_2370154 [Cupriavidus necator]|uniref:Uncharacterized protein n=1 Tax=Cupriavidus necator TaxID=106590 RepID=A0A1K0IF78_CUPNE|nr:hypothetical protein CNECB9_2370154 [Cupriavidus necator]